MGKHKQGICMAEGGIAPETPEQLMARMAAKYGAPTGAAQPAAPQPQQAPAPVAKPPEKSANPLTNLTGIFNRRKEQIDRATNYANGGIAGHVKFEGKGGPRDDQIPVKVAGQNINVSDGEQALIIPAKTAANAQAMEMIQKIIADSNDGRQPDMGQGGANFANGGLLDDEAQKMNYQAVTGSVAPSPTPQPAAQPASSGWGFGKSGPGATLQVTPGDQARLPSPVVRQGIDTMRGQIATPQPAVVAGSNYVGNGPTDPDVNSRQAIAAPSGAVRRGIETMRSQLNQNPMASENARASAAANEHVQSLYPAGTFDKPTVNPIAAPNIPGVSNAVAATPQPAASSSSIGDDIRAKHQNILNGQQSVADQGALDALKAKTPAKDGILRVTEMPAGSKSPDGRDISRQKLITNVGGDGTAGMSATSVNPLGIAGQPQGNPNLGTASDNMRQIANIKALQEMTPQGGIGILNDPNEAANAEKTQRWRQDDLLSEARRGNQAAVGAAIHANAAIDNEASRANTAANNAAVATRGQDLAAKNDAARIAASTNQEDRQLKQAQAQGIMAQTESAKMLADIQKKAMAGDKQAMASYRALTGKGGAENMRDNFMAVGGGQEFDATANVMRNVPQRLIDLRTGQEVGGQAKQQGAETFSSKADLQAAIKSGKVKSGQTVMTPNGQMVVN